MRCVLQVLKGTTRYAGKAEAGPGEAAGYKEYTQTEVMAHIHMYSMHATYLLLAGACSGSTVQVATGAMVNVKTVSSSSSYVNVHVQLQRSLHGTD
jgi:hypothetical protein